MAVLALNPLPVGYRFSPTDEELVNYYLKGKIEGEESKVEAISEVEICKLEPWDLPNLSAIKNNDPEWFFFCPLNRKYPKGRRSHRATEAGYWKATGKDRTIKSRTSAGTKAIGMKKTLVFHLGRAPGGKKTDWIMHEYRTNSEEDAFVLCRLFNKEKTESSNCEEIEPTGSSPTTTNSSLDGMPSDVTLVPSNSESGLQAGEQTSVSRRLPDKDNTTSHPQLLEDSHNNSCKVSDVGDHGAEVDTELGLDEWLSFLNDAENEPMEKPNGVGDSGSPFFANDGCYTLMSLEVGGNGNELDSFDPESVDKILDGQNDYCNESAGQIFPIESEHGSAGHNMLQTIMTEFDFDKDNVSCSDTDNEVLQQPFSELETSLRSNPHVDTKHLSETVVTLESRRTEASYSGDHWRESMYLLGGDSILPDASSADSATCFYGRLEESKLQTNPDNTSDNIFETGIKLKSRQPMHAPSTIMQAQSARLPYLQGASVHYLEPKSDQKTHEGSFYGTIEQQGGPVFHQGFAQRRIRLQNHAENDETKSKKFECDGELEFMQGPGEAVEHANTVAGKSKAGISELEVENLSKRFGLMSNALEEDSRKACHAPPLRFSGRCIVLVVLVAVLVGFFLQVWRCS